MFPAGESLWTEARPPAITGTKWNKDYEKATGEWRYLYLEIKWEDQFLEN